MNMWLESLKGRQVLGPGEIDRLIHTAIGLDRMVEHQRKIVRGMDTAATSLQMQRDKANEALAAALQQRDEAQAVCDEYRAVVDRLEERTRAVESAFEILRGRYHSVRHVQCGCGFQFRGGGLGELAEQMTIHAEEHGL